MKFYTKQHHYYCGIDLQHPVCLHSQSVRRGYAAPEYENGSRSVSQGHRALAG
jgi:hypothetical protein